jgi:hypothetical protein
MGYKKAGPFKMAPKTPLMKALVGNQNKLPQHLQDAIKAAPESPAKQTRTDSGNKASTPIGVVNGRKFDAPLTHAYELGRTHASKGKDGRAVQRSFNEAQNKAYLQGKSAYYNKK